MQAGTVSFKGVVLKSIPFKDKDRKIYVLSAERGIVCVIVKGCSSKNSKYSFLAMPFVFCDFTVNQTNSDYSFLKEASIIESNSKIFDKLESITIAYHIADVVCFTTGYNMDTSEIYLLTLYSLYRLSNHIDDYLLIMIAFNWRFLTVLGVTNCYLSCGSCGSDVGVSRIYYLQFESQNIVCDKCINGGSEVYIDNNLYIYGAGILALNHFAQGDYNKLFAVELGSKVVEQLKKFTIGYLERALDRKIVTLDKLDELEGSHRV